MAIQFATDHSDYFLDALVLMSEFNFYEQYWPRSMEIQ